MRSTTNAIGIVLESIYIKRVVSENSTLCSSKILISKSCFSVSENRNLRNRVAYLPLRIPDVSRVFSLHQAYAYMMWGPFLHDGGLGDINYLNILIFIQVDGKIPYPICFRKGIPLRMVLGVTFRLIS